MQVQVVPVSDNAKDIFNGLMEKNDKVDLEQAKDGWVLIASRNRQYSVWTPLDGDDWKVVLPSGVNSTT